MITINEIVKKYDNHVALNGVSCSIPSQSICAIIGPNGAGKSTLLKILTKILDYNSGTIEYGADFNMSSFRQNISYLPEQRGLYSGISIETQLRFFASIRGVCERSAYNNVHYWLKKFDIEHWKDRRISELSKGMQQKIQFISCLVSAPKLVFMDEPFSGVDPVNFKLFAEILKEYQMQSNSTVILSTHNMKSVEELCDNIVVLNKGNVEAAGAINEVKQSFVRGNMVSVDIFIGNNQKAQENILSSLKSVFHIVDTHVDQGHLFVDFTDLNNSPYMKSMQQALTLLDGYEVYHCARKVMSIEDIFIELSK